MEKIEFTQKITPEFIEWLTSRRDEHGWTITELASRVSMTRGHIHKVLSGEKDITLKLCYSLAMAFSVPTTEVLSIAGFDTPELEPAL